MLSTMLSQLSHSFDINYRSENYPRTVSLSYHHWYEYVDRPSVHSYEADSADSLTEFLRYESADIFISTILLRRGFVWSIAAAYITLPEANEKGYA